MGSIIAFMLVEFIYNFCYGIFINFDIKFKWYAMAHHCKLAHYRLDIIK